MKYEDIKIGKSYYIRFNNNEDQICIGKVFCIRSKQKFHPIDIVLVLINERVMRMGFKVGEETLIEVSEIISEI